MSRKAMDTLEFLSQDREARYLYDMRQKALRDEISMILGANEEGEKKGREEGRQEGRQEGSHLKALQVAANMLNKGMDVATIVEVTGLSTKDIDDLKNRTQ
jgi:predicted transposase/invertase (TIGR01784 family)